MYWKPDTKSLYLPLATLSFASPVLVGEGPVGMQKDVGACDGSLRFAVECLHRHFMIGRADDLDGEGE